MRVGAVGVRSQANEAERLAGRILNASAGAAAGVGEVDVVENVEDLNAGFCLEAFLEREQLGDGEVHVLKASVTEDVRFGVAVGTVSCGNQDGGSDSVATKVAE